MVGADLCPVQVDQEHYGTKQDTDAESEYATFELRLRGRIAQVCIRVVVVCVCVCVALLPPDRGGGAAGHGAAGGGEGVVVARRRRPGAGRPQPCALGGTVPCAQLLRRHTPPLLCCRCTPCWRSWIAGSPAATARFCAAFLARYGPAAAAAHRNSPPPNQLYVLHMVEWRRAFRVLGPHGTPQALLPLQQCCSLMSTPGECQVEPALLPSPRSHAALQGPPIGLSQFPGVPNEDKPLIPELCMVRGFALCRASSRASCAGHHQHGARHLQEAHDVAEHCAAPADAVPAGQGAARCTRV